jgi:hypothetical protein
MGLGAGAVYLLSSRRGQPDQSQISSKLNEVASKTAGKLKGLTQDLGNRTSDLLGQAGPSAEANKPSETKSLQVLSELSGQPRPKEQVSAAQPDQEQGGWHDALGVQLNQELEKQRDEQSTSQDAAERRESGEPGGGQGRRDEVGNTGIYPVSSGQMPPGDEVIRTPGEYGQRGRGLEGYYDHGESGFTQAEVQIYGAQPGSADQDQPAAEAKKPENKVPVKDFDSETAVSGMVDVNQDNIDPASL